MTAWWGGRRAARGFLCALATGSLGCEWVAGVRDVSLADASTGSETAVDGAGDGSGDGASDAADAPVGDCTTTKGAAMVSVPDGLGGSYCIDVTEVTEADYAKFAIAVSDPKTLPLPARCAAISVAHPDTWTVSGAPGAPRVWVHWCHAWAYCHWAGKRLCGVLGTGKPATEEGPSEWTQACSQGGSTLFPYGDKFDEAACTTGYTDAGRTTPSAVQAAPACHGAAAPYDAIFDMSGNVAEWVDDCGGAPEECAVRGGYFGDRDLAAACNARVRRGFGDPVIGVGFRCCR